MLKYNRNTLYLNADYMPVLIRHWTKAITLVYKDKAVQVDFYENDEIKGAHGKVYPVPAVIALKQYIHRDYQKAPFSRMRVLARDKYCCQYCLQEFKASDLTMDHVIPRSKWKGPGTPTCWTNIVTACFSCNSRKADRTCDEADMFPANPPVQPGYDEIFFGLHCHGKIEKEWLRWLQVFNIFKDANING